MKFCIAVLTVTLLFTTYGAAWFTRVAWPTTTELRFTLVLVWLVLGFSWYGFWKILCFKDADD